LFGCSNPNYLFKRRRNSACRVTLINMSFELSDVLKAIGPTASIIFAAWIFMGFLQQRYDAAVSRYREAISDFRTGCHAPDRHDNIRDQILVFKRRCELMNYACMAGLVSAILFLLTLIAGELDAILPQSALLAMVGSITAFGGLTLVMVGSVLVLMEASYAHRQFDAELLDVPDLAENTGQQPGMVREKQPRHIANASR
jgi:Protein of unknown function (DUF2721)